MLAGPVEGTFDAIYALDVLEHIAPDAEHRFLANAVASLSDTGIAIFGMPSLESQAYASPQSKEGHVNCKTGKDLKATLETYFHSVFIFSMNDEVVHTGFYPMAHYLMGVCAHPKRA
jgi:2-polyprenyl-3-methyl-5-hydroxy-6-metoxy-1,4-benzoquinol methylase